MSSKQKVGFRKKLALNVFSKYVDAQSKLHDLTYLFWECTLRCNINCLHCGSDCHKESGVRDMPARDFLDVAKQVSEHYNPNKVMIVITGGEPLVRRDLAEVGKELYQMGFPWGFVTNGYALSEKRLDELLASGLRSVTVSLDGFRENHDWLRGVGGSYERALHAVKLLVNAENIIFDVVSCMNQRNKHELAAIRDMLIEMGVKKWRIFTIFPIGRAKENPELHTQPDDFIYLMDFIKETRKEGKIHLSYGCEGYLGNYENEVRDGYFFCRAGVNISSVLADGSIGACPNINHKYVQGNIYEDDFMDVWQNRYELYRNRDWMQFQSCENCEVFRYCRGNGMHLRDPETGDVLTCHYGMLAGGK